MAINRFDQTVNSRLISQFAPEDLNLIAKVLSSKQARFDKEEAKIELAQDEFSKLSGVGEADNAFLREQGLELNAIAEEYSGRDLSDPRVAKELRSKTRQLTNNKQLQQIQRSTNAVQAHAKAVEKSKLDGDYRIENDPFASQLQQYKGTEESAPLSFTGIIKGVDERVAAEKYVDNVPVSGLKTLVMFGESIKTVGWEGRTTLRMSEQVLNSIDSFSDSSAGQQALRRYKIDLQNGTIPEDVTAKEYLAKILGSAAAERVGIKQTVAGGSVNLVTGEQREQVSSTPDLGVTFVPPQAKKFADAEPSFSAEGGLEGSGTSSFIEIFDGKSFWDILTDDSLTKEEKDLYLPVTILSQVNGITNEEAMKAFDKTIAPVINTFSKKQRTDVEDSFFVKGAGLYKGYTTYDEAGNVSTGQQVFKDLGILDSSGNFDPEMAKTRGIVITGQVEPGTGPTANGLYISTSQGDYIFERPATDAQKEIFDDSQAMLYGIMTATSGKDKGKTFVMDPKTGTFGIWNPNTGIIDH